MAEVLQRCVRSFHSRFLAPLIDLPPTVVPLPKLVLPAQESLEPMVCNLEHHVDVSDCTPCAIALSTPVTTSSSRLGHNIRKMLCWVMGVCPAIGLDATRLDYGPNKSPAAFFGTMTFSAEGMVRMATGVSVRGSPST